MQNPETKPSIAIIGAGKVGLTIGVLAREKGYRICAVAGRNQQRLEHAASLLGSAPILSIEDAATTADILFLSVSDDAIEPLCAELAGKKRFKLEQIVVHFSGALSSEALAPARDAGALVASTHPLQTFSNLDSAMSAMPGTYWFCEGDAAALNVLKQFIIEIDGHPRLIPTDKKALYHAASVIACNYLDSLMDIALKVAEEASLDRSEAWQVLEPLVQATLKNISSSGTVNALTGPIARGDCKTVERHIEALSATDVEVADLYKMLGLWTAKISARKGLPPEQINALKQVLTRP
jgi:predicted short-subunit dehydrogenase-like oxidoreductase (DUF2520 family)